MVRIRFIGSGNAFNDGGRLNQCVAIELKDKDGVYKPVILIDCGPGVPGVLRKTYGDQDVNNINYLLLTHFHGDHTAGIPFFLLNSKYMSSRTTKIIVIGPRGTGDQVRGLNKLCYPSALEDPGFPLEFIELDPKTDNKIKNGFEFSITAIPIKHRPESLGYRIAIDNKTIAITGDASWTESVIELGKDADLYIMECNDFTSISPHLNYEEISANKNKISAKKIILNHLGATMLENLDKVKIETASDGYAVEI